MRHISREQGFTLIELLVVISIIGLLSSVVLASLNAARTKSKDASIRNQAAQMRILLEQEYNETGRYSDLQPNQWVTQSSDCDTISLSGNHAAQARLICKAIATNASLTYTTLKMHMGTQNSSPSQYAMMVALPDKNTFFCLGSSGRNSDNTDLAKINSPSPWTNPGCWSNP